MLDPITALALSMYAGKGVYALLIGSGVSRAAEIPTGWEITLDLVRQIAVASGEDVCADPTSWYVERFGKEPDYSEVLAEIALSASERTNALSQYFEATGEERERGAKVPTAAHKAIARLVAKGYVKVLLTTNFDRLLEQALELEGVSATVISSDDMVLGAVPLTHASCTVIKLHGDYRDTRFRNTIEELAAYSPEMDRLLNRVIDEYGFVVAGWSATWDSALRAAFTRAVNRRYSMTWAAKGKLTKEAEDLISFRNAAIVAIESADVFFTSLTEKLFSLEKFHAPHPMSVEIGVASLKRYLSEDKYRIDLYDLLTGETERTLADLASSEVFKAPAISPGGDFDALLKRCEIGSSMLLAFAGNFSFFSSTSFNNIWGSTLTRILSAARDTSGYVHLRGVKMYPACLIFYTIGVAACVSDHYSTLVPLFRSTNSKLDSYREQDEPIFMAIYASKVLEPSWVNSIGERNDKFPASERVFVVIREALRLLVPDDEAYADAFDRFEYLLALRVAECNAAKKPFPRFWGPAGRFGYRRREYGIHVSKRLQIDIEQSRGLSPLISQGLFATAEEVLELNRLYVDEVLKRISTW